MTEPHLMLTHQDRKILARRLAWLESKESVAGMTNAKLFSEEADAIRKVLAYEDERRQFEAGDER